jgi:hypothetical protein
MKKTVIKRIIFSLLSIFFVVLIIKAIDFFEKPKQYEYFFSNQSDDEIIIRYSEYNKNQQEFKVKSNTTICLSDYNFVDYQESKINQIFSKILVFDKLDTISIDLSKEKYWIYEEKNRIGKYKLVMTNKNFKNN